MRKTNKIILSVNATIREAITVIDRGVMQIALVLDNDKLLGTITDGDIRRGFLQGKTLDDSIEGLYNRNPVKGFVNHDPEDIIQLALSRGVKQIPIVDDDNSLVGIEYIDDYLRVSEKPNLVILMAGGLGTRLRPLTETTPKPMLNVGQKPILETIIESFSRHGFRNFLLSVNYRAEQIKQYFADGERFGVSIRYITETKRLGTAGALSLLPERPIHPILVMNGDLLTGLNFEHLLNYHIHARADATMCVRDYEFQVPFGVVRTQGAKICTIEEKPSHHFYVNAGIYVLQPDAIDIVPQDSFYDMPQLYQDLIDAGRKVCSFPVKEYWLDIGRPTEFEQAQNEYAEHFDV
ncbi:MAG: nucleotidyltransferase family protein [Desulfobulbaceae bacterium]|nr:nucleotidyltransferase family protein [Desulfobulbaceae bacterium]